MILREFVSQFSQFAAQRFIQLPVVDLQDKSTDQLWIDLLGEFYFLLPRDLQHDLDKFRTECFIQRKRGSDFGHLDGMVKLVKRLKFSGNIRQDLFSSFSADNLKKRKGCFSGPTFLKKRL